MLADADASLSSTTNVMTDPRYVFFTSHGKKELNDSASMTQSEKNVLLELEKILQTCIQM